MAKWLCWLEIVCLAAAAAFFAGFVVCVVRRWVLGGYADREAMAVFSIVWFAALTALFVIWIKASFRKLKFSAALSDEGVRIGDDSVPWDWIDRVDQTPSLAGPAFAIHTSKRWRSYPVYAVEQASELEDLIRARLLADADSTTSDQPLQQYSTSRRWRRRVAAVHIIMECAVAATIVVMFLQRYSLLWAILLLSCYRSIANGLNVLRFASAAVFDRALRVGDTVVRWDEIDQIEQSRMPGVAFRIRMRDGKRLNVYSGLENLGELESVITQRLAARQ